MSALRVAVIGVGHLGRIHARLLSQVAGVELAGVVDPIAEARQAAAVELNTSAHADHQPLVGQIDAAIVATPTREHHAVALDLLQHGVHVFVEKPITLNVGDASELVAVAEAQGLVLQVGHVERFNPAFVAAAPHIDHPKYIEATRASSYACRSTDIGVVLDLMIHDIDLVLSLVQDELVSVSALGAAVIGPNEDWAQARLTFANGCVANLAASRVAWQAQRSMQVVSREAMLGIDFAARTAKRMSIGPAVSAGELDVQGMTAAERAHLKDHLFDDYLPLNDLPVTESNALLEEQREFASAIRGEGQVRVSGQAGLRALDVAERILTQIAAHAWESTPDGAIGPRFESREAGDTLLRGPHWHQSRQIIRRRLAG